MRRAKTHPNIALAVIGRANRHDELTLPNRSGDVFKIKCFQSQDRRMRLILGRRMPRILGTRTVLHGFRARLLKTEHHPAGLSIVGYVVVKK